AGYIKGNTLFSPVQPVAGAVRLTNGFIFVSQCSNAEPIITYYPADVLIMISIGVIPSPEAEFFQSVSMNRGIDPAQQITRAGMSLGNNSLCHSFKPEIRIKVHLAARSDGVGKVDGTQPLVVSEHIQNDFILDLGIIPGIALRTLSRRTPFVIPADLIVQGIDGYPKVYTFTIDIKRSIRFHADGFPIPVAVGECLRQQFLVNRDRYRIRLMKRQTAGHLFDLLVGKRYGQGRGLVRPLVPQLPDVPVGIE